MDGTEKGEKQHREKGKTRRVIFAGGGKQGGQRTGARGANQGKNGKKGNNWRKNDF